MTAVMVTAVVAVSEASTCITIGSCDGSKPLSHAAGPKSEQFRMTHLSDRRHEPCFSLSNIRCYGRERRLTCVRSSRTAAAHEDFSL